MGRKKKRDHMCDKCGYQIPGTPLKFGGKILCPDQCREATRRAAFGEAVASLSDPDE